MTNRFKQARMNAVMTQEHLAAAAGVSVSTVRRLETDGAASPESKRAIAAVLGIDVAEKQGVPKVQTVHADFGTFIFTRRKDSRMLMVMFTIMTAIAAISVLQALSDPRGMWAVMMLLTAPAVLMGPVMALPGMLSRPWRSYVIAAVVWATGVLSWIILAVVYPLLNIAPEIDLLFVAFGWAGAGMACVVTPMIKRAVLVTHGTRRIGGSPRQKEIARRAGDRPVLVFA